MPGIYPQPHSSNGTPVLLGPDGKPIRPSGDVKGDARGIMYPNGFAFALPPSSQFVGEYKGGGNTFLHGMYDEAIRKSREDAESLVNQSDIMGPLTERFRGVVGLNWHIAVPDDRDEKQKSVRDGLTRLVKTNPHLPDLLGQWMWAVWYGRSGVQVEWDWCAHEGGAIRNGRPSGLYVADWAPVEGDKIGHQLDGTPYVLINSGRSHELGKGAEIINTSVNRALALRGTWRERVLIHYHERRDAPYFSPDKADMAHGVGIRSTIFWWQFIKMEMWGWILQFFERAGLGVTVWKYPAGNPQALIEIQNAAREHSNRAHLFVPVHGDSGKEIGGVERIEVPTAGAAALREFIEYIDTNYIERYIIGQSGSARADSAGAGIGNEAAHKLLGACVPVDGSEILTRDGFKAAGAAQIGEEVLAYDCETGTCRWTPLLDKTFYSDMAVHRFGTEGGRFEAVCTADHSWATEKLPWMYKKGETKVGRRGAVSALGTCQLVKANAINGGEKVILAAPETETTESLLTPTEAAVLGWVVTDGTIGRRPSGGVSVRICQSKEKNFPAIRKLVAAIDPNTRECVSKPFTRTFPTGRTYDCLAQHWWVIPFAAGADLLNKCGFHSRADLPRIVTRLSVDARRAMLEAFLLAEGDVRDRFYNGDPHIMDAFEILCALEGRATGKIKPHETIFTKEIKRTRHVNGGNLRLTSAGRADVWCPTTQYGTWVMRQNGRVMVTGNTKTQIIVQDANRLAAHLTGTPKQPGLLSVMKRCTYPTADFPVWWVFDVETSDSPEKMSGIEKLVSLNLPVKTDDLYRSAGLSKPGAGDETLTPPPQMGGMLGAGGTPGAAPPGGGGMGDLLGGGTAPPDAGTPDTPERQPGEMGDFLTSLQEGRSLEDAIRYVRGLSPEAARNLLPDDYLDVEAGAEDTLAPLLLQYAWVRRGKVGTSRGGKPVYRWYNPARRETRTQTIKPNTSELLGGSYVSDPTGSWDALGGAAAILQNPEALTQQSLRVFARTLAQMDAQELAQVRQRLQFIDDSSDPLTERAVALARSAIAGEEVQPDPEAAVRAVFGLVEAYPRDENGTHTDAKDLWQYLEKVIRTVPQ
jgi:hypothetical protein